MGVKVSVIAPVYNVEKYLSKAIESMLSQTLSDIEIILVDDGSTDDCLSIARSYELKDSRVKVIHQENAGAAAARNAGMKIASGEFLYFLDPDDWAEEDMLSSMYSMAEDTQADVVISGFVMEYFEGGKNFSINVIPDRKEYSSQDEFRKNAHIYLNNMMFAVPWNKLYRAEYIFANNLEFPVVAWDDLHFNAEVFRNVKKVSVCDACYYHFYRSRSDSETAKVFDLNLYTKRKEQFRHILSMYKEWDIHQTDIVEAVYGYYASRIVQCVSETAIARNIPFSDRVAKINEIINDKLTIKAIRKQRIDSKLVKLSLLVLKTRIPSLCFAYGYLVGFAKKHMSVVFQHLKAKTMGQI